MENFGEMLGVPFQGLLSSKSHRLITKLITRIDWMLQDESIKYNKSVIRDWLLYHDIV
jgi:hypothetical protein